MFIAFRRTTRAGMAVSARFRSRFGLAVALLTCGSFLTSAFPGSQPPTLPARPLAGRRPTFLSPRRSYRPQYTRSTFLSAFAAADNAALRNIPPSSHGYKPKVWAYYRSRSKIIEWYCQELGLDYEAVQVDMGAGQHKASDFIKNVNHFGKLPVITMANGTPLIESGAQLLYLADVFDPNVSTAEERGLASQWTHFANASLGPSIFMKEQREAGVMDKFFAVLNQLLAESSYLQGERFGVGDVAVGSYLSYIPVFFPDQISLDAYPFLRAYINRITSRPAFKRTVGAPPPSTA